MELATTNALPNWAGQKEEGKRKARSKGRKQVKRKEKGQKEGNHGLERCFVLWLHGATAGSSCPETRIHGPSFQWVHVELGIDAMALS